ncbi:glycosyltransferase family 9 protein [Bosea psychrotolerans]|uniref:ADP-heptose:LPS heptosyltransferase n=1 Tax=Bosea psychrotolerans TaxID=1871628 RepID=A0A2S4MF00_9HYPH|nr:glycosyltransferase family 9 protein [Bosea psychrotolerans]POR53304.1 ADP-heptose:LPS heptosyltransferase [Bosea psychrotolerans]
MKKLSRQLRELMVPRENALLLAQADAARDDGAWSKGAELYRQFVRLHPDRNGLWMQSGHCLKEMGRCRTALFDYLAVSHEEDKPEADFHAGVLLKHTGNSAAAKWAFARSAARGHALSVSELDRLARGETVLRRGFFERAVETGEDETRMLERLFALELAPLDWRRLAAAAEDAAIRGFTEPAQLLADLALVIGGPVAERQLPYRTILSASGLWGDRYARHLQSPAFASMKPAEALGRLIDTLDFDTPLADHRFGGGSLASQDADLISVVEADGGEDVARLQQAAAAIAVIKDRLFGEKDDCASGLVEAIITLSAAFPAKGRPVYAALPEQGGYSLAAILRRVCLNATAAIADRLAAQLRIAPAAVVASFAVPTARATLATCAASDTVPAVVAIEARSDDPAAQQKLSDLVALGLIPDSGSGAAERLLALAEQGRQAPMEYWFSVSAPTTPPALVGEIAIRVANALKRRGAAAQALLWTERAAAAVPELYTMDLGIQRKTNGDFAGAVSAFSWVLTNAPAHESATWELNSVVRECLNPREIADLVKQHPSFGTLYLATEEEERRKRAEANARSAPTKLAAVLDIVDLRDTLDFGAERLECHQIGWLRSEVGGKSFPRLVGVVAIRLCHVTRDPPQRLRLRFDGKTIDIVAPSPSGVDSNGVGKYYFNSWVDTRDLPRGPARLQAYVEQKSSGYSIFEETVVIDDLKPGEDYDRSDAFVPSPSEVEPGAGLVDRVLATPATAREATRSAFDRPVKRVLVMRLDQLGDLSASMPAIRRLREVFPQARFEGLVTPVNAYILRTSGLFDEIFTVDFTYDHGTRRRWLGRGAHGEIKRRYDATPVDIAIDLSPGDDSRPILTLINARYRAGFKPHRFDFLDFGIDLLTRDPVNRKEAVSHTAMISAFVEALATMFKPPPPRFPAATELLRHLEPLGLKPRDYIAIHVGARLAIKRWPLGHYIALAGLLRAETGRDIVMFSDDPVPEEQMAAIGAIGGIQLKAGRTEFDIFDALISNAAVFIGNDTGPKHLASMRGVKTVSVHMNQVNWNEWGQDGEGLIVSKRIPCCGCGIEDPSECGKAMACLDGLTPRELADAVGRVLQA